MTNKQIVVKAILNITSGISMVTLLTLGVMWLSFSNAFVFRDAYIEIVNNPITKNEDIHFMMVGYKKHECKSTNVYGVAYAEDGSHTHKLNQFRKSYVQNTSPGRAIPNQWSMAVPSDMVEGGDYRVTMTGEFVCNHLIFQKEKTQTYNNIFLHVEARK